MTIVHFAYYLLLWASGLLLLAVTFLRYQRTGDPFLSSYSWYLLAFETTAFVSIIGGAFVSLASPPRHLSAAAIETSSMALTVLSVPLMFVCWFFFLKMTANLMGRKVGGAVAHVYLAAQLVAAAAFGIMISNFAAEPTSASARTYAAAYNVVRWSGGLIRFWALAQIAIFAGSLRDAGRRKAVLKFGAAYAILLAAYYGMMLIPASRAVSVIFYPTVYFVKNYIPLLYMLAVLRRESRDYPADPQGLAFPDHLAQARGLSKREREIVALILAGKNNVDIHKALFISPGTVRNHVSAIYRKLGLKNRYQLLVLARENDAATPVDGKTRGETPGT